MEKTELARFRKKIKKTQKEMAQLLGKSVKAIHSYEQGWRRIPTDVERQVFFLASRIDKELETQPPCWEMLNCGELKKKNCPAWEFNAGNRCWFINGTICEGSPCKSWNEKINICKSCEVFRPVLKQFKK